jgi:prepilin-type N-terminal cleavage/methylation domain-containing protein
MKINFIPKTNHGFTLVELMAVVAIIGVLSSVSMPIYRDYQVKARSVEGKLILASIHTVQSAWYASYDVYSSCLGMMGVNKPAGHFYSFGFTSYDSVPLAIDINALAVANGAPQGCVGVGEWTNSNVDPNAYFFQGTKVIGNFAAAPDRLDLGNDFFGVSDDGQNYQAVAGAFIGGSGISYHNFSIGLISSAYAQKGAGDPSNNGDSVITTTKDGSGSGKLTNDTGSSTTNSGSQSAVTNSLVTGFTMDKNKSVVLLSAILKTINNSQTNYVPGGTNNELPSINSNGKTTKPNWSQVTNLNSKGSVTGQ